MATPGSKIIDRLVTINTRSIVIGVCFAVLLFAFYFLQKHALPAIYAVAILWIFTVIAVLWLGNRYLFTILNRRVSWLKYTSKRFFLQLFLSGIYSLFCVNITYYLFKILTSDTAPDSDQIIVLNVYGLLFIIPVLSIVFGIYFMMEWKKAHIRSDKLKEESLHSQLEALRMHLDPHFLFNNLNVLSALIEKDPHTAQDFLERFVDVYRYVLQYKREELVAVKTELTFIESYVFLLKRRFENQLNIEIDIDESLSVRSYIPPLSLQMLIENAIKHNKISENRPLFIHICTEGEKFLVVKNNYQPKQQLEDNLNKSGLENIRKRYEFLSNSAIQLGRHDDSFMVKLPLLEMEDSL